MKKIIVFVLILFLAGCSNIKESVKEVKKETIKKDKIDIMLENMSIEEKIAQMLIIEYDSDYVDDNLKSFLNMTPPGGFILMKENITTFDKTRQFVSDLKENSRVPLIISIDEEGGSVQRLKYLMDASVSDIPFMYNVGLTNNYDLAYNIGKLIAEEVRTIGVNVDFAPVIDIYSNPNNTVIGKRSFGSDAEIVSNMAVHFTKGLEDNGVIGVYKHFPGHGDTDIDSHESLPIINKSLDDLKAFELVPFKSAVKAGAKMIMVGHIAIPEVTHDNTPDDSIWSKPYLYLLGFLGLGLVNVIMVYTYPDMGIETVITYNDNPLVVLQCICIFRTFERLDLSKLPRISSVINYISAGNLGVYMIHEHPIIRYVIWSRLFTTDSLTFYTEEHYLLIFILIIILVYSGCWMIDWWRRMFVSLIKNKPSGLGLLNIIFKSWLVKNTDTKLIIINKGIFFFLINTNKSKLTTINE